MSLFVGHLHGKANEVDALSRGLFLKYSILTLTVHRTSTVGAVNHFLSPLMPSCYKDYGNLWCISQSSGVNEYHWAALQTCSSAHSFSSILPVPYPLLAYTFWIRIPQGQF